MMYGAIGVVGWLGTQGLNFYDATDLAGIDHYQQWIVYQTEAYRLLTTTVHANEANRLLRNAFRTRFRIDCVCFRPDETCPGYTDSQNDLWLAVTQWNDVGVVASGPADRVTELRWCTIGTEAFERDGRGYRAVLRPELRGRNIVRAGYQDLATRLRAAYMSKNDLVITEF